MGTLIIIHIIELVNIILFLHIYCMVKSKQRKICYTEF